MYLLARAASILTARYGSKRLCSLNGLYSLNNLSGQNDLDSLISSKKITELDGWIIPSTQMIKTRPLFVEWILKNPIFYWYLTPFLSEAVEVSSYYWLMKVKCPNLLKPLSTLIQQDYWFFYPTEPFSFVHFNMIHPVCTELCTWLSDRPTP